MNREQRRAAARAARKPGKAVRRHGHLLLDPMAYVKSGVQPLTPEQQHDLGVRSHGALTSMSKGPGTDQDGADLAAMAEVTFALIEPLLERARRTGDAEQVQVSEAALAIAQQAREAVLAVSQRAARSAGRWVLAGPELTALNECMELHDQFLQIAPQQLVEHAVITARKRATARRDELLSDIRRAA